MSQEKNFYIAAVGVSAGGQEPLHSFFAQLPPNSGIAFIVIPHLNRDYVSVADKLLRKHTTMPVSWATQGQEVQPNHIYILPVNNTMTIEEGHLFLRNREVDDPINWAVDIFFKSLAKGEKANAVGIILSGLARMVHWGRLPFIISRAWLWCKTLKQPSSQACQSPLGCTTILLRCWTPNG
jgi:two-component system CheB/CheR fusion protein